MNLINERNLNVYCFDSYFFVSLCLRGYDGVKRIVGKLKFDLFSKKKLLFPICLKSHWTLVCVNLESKEVQYYDSLHGRNIASQETIFKFLNNAHLQINGSPLRTEGWKILTVQNIPHQKNGYDCGVFLCTYAEYLARGVTFNFSQEHMLSFRQLIAYELTVKRLVDVNVDAEYIDSFIMSVINS